MKPRIAVMLSGYGVIHRGTENFIRNFVKYLSDDFEITVLARVKTAEYTKSFFCIPATNRLLQYIYRFNPVFSRQLDRFCLNPDHIEALTFSLSVFPYLLTQNYDLLFPQTGFWGALACRIIRKLKGTPFIYRSAGGIEPLVARQKPQIYFCINPAIERWFHSHFPKMRTQYICNGIDTHHFYPNGQKAWINLPHPIVMTASALVDSKQVDLTIKAVGKIKKTSLLVVGAGPLKESLKNLAEKEIGKDRFLFVKSDYEHMPEYYRAADVFAFSAPGELGWGMVHLEAAASGLPIVANKEENLELLLGEKAYICDVRNIYEYSSYIEKAIVKPKSLRRLIMKYSWEPTAKKYKKYIYGIITQPDKVS